LNDGAWFFNTSRGSVVDGEALRKARAAGPVSAAGLDVWENEPVPDPALVEVVDLATPHIAGYAYDGKVRGTRMLYDALCEELEVKGTWDASAVLRPASKDALGCTPPDPRLPEPLWLDHLARQAYDLRRDDADLRAIPSDDATARAEAFKGLRAGYRRRREMQRYAVPASALPAAYVEAVERGLTIGVN
jgi:erythronate-4-phosphate dehydrogenase